MEVGFARFFLCHFAVVVAGWLIAVEALRYRLGIRLEVKYESIDYR
jgi:hypothetical protein